MRVPEVHLLAVTAGVADMLITEATFEATSGIVLDGAGPLACIVATAFVDQDRDGFLVSDRRTRKLIGSCSFIGPDVDGVIEIDCFTFPMHQRQGYGGAMLRAACAEAAHRAGVRALMAITAAEAGSAPRILERLGFSRSRSSRDLSGLETDAAVWRWTRPISPGLMGEPPSCENHPTPAQ
jgi:GNAT superfamily N-acetyltransferase